MSDLAFMPIILLAAGASHRMRGRDKLMEDIDGIPLLKRQAMMCRAATQGAVIVALPPVPHARYDALADVDVTALTVGNAHEGMNASLSAAIAVLPLDATCAMVVLADLPDLAAEDLKIVAQQVDLTSKIKIWRGTTQDGAPGHPIVFKADLFDEISALKGDTGGRDVVAHYKDQTMLIPLPGERARIDLDTPEDWAVWRKKRQTAP